MPPTALVVGAVAVTNTDHHDPVALATDPSDIVAFFAAAG